MKISFEYSEKQILKLRKVNSKKLLIIYIILNFFFLNFNIQSDSLSSFSS